MNLDQQQFECTGCCACHDICPVDAITIKKDKEGFLHYQIDSEKCIHCGKCVRICPKIKYEIPNEPVKTCFAAYHKDPEVVKHSSSGGLFTALALAFLRQNGVVVGAAWKGNQIHHILIEKESDIAQLQGSKYLQSNLEGIYQQVIEQLKQGRKVLFSGTPCQIAALQKVVQDENLYTIDVVCHGVPSMLTYQNSIEARFQKKFLKVNFRYKNPSWKNFILSYENGTELKNNTDGWFKRYLNNSFLKKDCYACPFVGENRCGDLSLGDFWGIEHVDFAFFEQNQDRGVTIITLNNEKGKQLFETIKEDIVWKEENYELAPKYNCRLNKGTYDTSFLQRRDQFWKDFEKQKIVWKDGIEKPRPLWKRVLSKIKRTIKGV